MGKRGGLCFPFPAFSCHQNPNDPLSAPPRGQGAPERRGRQVSLGFQGPVRAGIRKRDEPFGWLARQSPGDSDTPWSLRLVLSRFSVLGPHGSTPGPRVRGVPGRPAAELAFLRHEAGGAGGRGPLRGAARAVSALRCALPRAARFGASPRTLASANQVARHLPPAPATWRGDEVLGSVQGQHSKRRGCQRSLARAAAAPSARRPEGRVQTPWEPRAGVAPRRRAAQPW